VSGTYKCSDNMSYQTGLPLEKFWCLTQETQGSCDNGDANKLVVSSAVTLRQVLRHTEAEFALASKTWAAQVTRLREEDAEATAARQVMTQERCAAVVRYGYLSEVSVGQA
jgi:hypothetical protein